jgi:hypothetical protein
MEDKDVISLLLNQIDKRDKALDKLIDNMNTTINKTVEAFNKTLRRQLTWCVFAMVIILSVFFIGYFFSDYSYDKTTTTSNYNENKNINDTTTNGGAK